MYAARPGSSISHSPAVPPSFAVDLAHGFSRSRVLEQFALRAGREGESGVAATEGAGAPATAVLNFTNSRVRAPWHDCFLICRCNRQVLK